MLRRLEIQNYAIIEKLILDLEKGLTIITGETGAGKSILLGALNLIMGQRADSKVLYEKDKKAFVEVVFDVKPYNLKKWFEEHDLDYEDEVIIRRVISANGKSRAFLNDEPINLSLLKKVTDNLVDMHQQFDMLDIHSISFQTHTVDALARQLDTTADYTSKYQQYLKKKGNLAKLIEQEKTAKTEIDFLRFQMSEFDKLAIESGEQEEKEALLNRLNNSEDIKRVSSQITHELEEAESNIIDRLRVLTNEVDSIKEGDAELEQIYSSLSAMMEELQDIARSAGSVADNTEYDPKTIEELSQRLDAIYKLQQKHSVSDIDSLLEVQDNIAEKLNSFSDLSADIASLEKEIEKDNTQLTKLATAISKGRKKIIPTIEKEIKTMLSSLSMEHAVLSIKLEETQELSPSGLDRAVFYFKANKGSELNLLKDVASGGEISRLTLCLKSLIADATVLPTLIFDEIDTGVSGDVAGKMGDILSSLSKDHQVITITHSPQIAARAHSHYFVYKEDRPERTVTGVQLLNSQERITEIAKMLSGNPPSEAAIANAEELISAN